MYRQNTRDASERWQHKVRGVEQVQRARDHLNRHRHPQSLPQNMQPTIRERYRPDSIVWRPEIKVITATASRAAFWLATCNKKSVGGLGVMLGQCLNQVPRVTADPCPLAYCCRIINADPHSATRAPNAYLLDTLVGPHPVYAKVPEQHDNSRKGFS
jgi:hypothetical protein